MQLYERRVSPNGKVTYVEHIPEVVPEDEPTILNMTDAQMLTAAGALGATLLILYERVLPPHKRVARKVKAVEQAIINLYHGVGEPVDNETLDFICKCWDETMKRAEFGEVFNAQ